MASEVGHAKNVNRFETLISKIVGFGGVYKPSNAAIELGQLQAKLADAQAAMDGVTGTLAFEKTGINERQNLNKMLRSLVTRSVNYYASTGAVANEVKDARSLKRKIDGKRATPIAPAVPALPGDDPATNHSSAQTGFVQQIEHLEDLIALYQSDAKYAPNEADLGTGALTAYSASLKTATTNVINKETDTTNARLTRKKSLYEGGICLFELQRLVKMYVKGLFGARSAQYKQVSGLKFVNYNE